MAIVKSFRVLLVVATAMACGPSRPPEDATRTALRVPVAPLANPTLRPARLVPVRPADDDKTYGTEPGGGKRMLVGGVRVIRLAGGGVLSAQDPLPSPPSVTVEVPERLGGGFLFVIGASVWRADKWLSPLRALYEPRMQPTQLFVGLDRAYVRLSNGAYAGFDVKTGTSMDLGPWPPSPEVKAYVAADGWRAVAIADLRGAVATFDAGSKWQPLALPIQPRELHQNGDAIVVTGVDTTGATQSYAVQPNGAIARLQDTTHEAHVHPRADQEDMARAAAKNPLAQAVLDGWPLEGGTALVARDGALSRVRVADGSVVDTAPDAFPLKPARCHAVSLSPPKQPAAFGFVCGAPHGATEIYAYDAHGGKLALLRHFDAPRAVFSPGNGTLVVEGACDADAVPVDVKKTEQTYCIMRKTQTFEDFVVNGDVGTERVVPLSDGRTAILSPPASDLATARITLFDGNKPSTIPIVFDGAKAPAPSKLKKSSDDDDDDEPTPPDDDSIVTAVLRSGTWLRGVEERSPGVLSAWVEHSGRYVGVEVNVNGHAKHGPYVADLGTAVVSGRYGLGWTPSRQGFETFDGGMTWRALALPEPLESAGPSSGAATHGCGPLGCVLAGWIRVGWGAEDSSTSNEIGAPPPREVRIASPESLYLKCELATAKPAPPSNDTTGTSNRSDYDYYGRYRGYGRYGYTPQTQDWQAFFSIEAPKLATDDLGWSRPVDDAWDRNSQDRSNTGHVPISRVARIYAWGPKGLDWEIRGRHFIRFTSPYESSSVLRTSQTTPIPRYITDATNFVGGGSYGQIAHPISHISLVPGDDDAHALLVMGRGYSYQTVGNDMVLVELEADRPAIEVHRADGQTLGEIESAVRMNGHWYIATTEPLSTAIWELENGSAREISRIPRTQEGNTRPVSLRLAKRADGHMIAAIVDGPPMTEGAARPSQWLNQTWALPIDVDSGTQHEPERLGLANGAGKPVHVCGPQDGGWVIDGRWPGGTINASTVSGASLHGSASNLLARYHVTADALCVEKVSLASYADTATAGSLGKVEAPFVTAGVYIDRARQQFRCVSSR
jgi:hypothetical protein